MLMTDHRNEDTSSDVDHDAEKPAVKATDAPTVGTERQAEPADEKTRRKVSISLRTLIFAAVTCVLISAVGVLAWLNISTQNQLDAQAREAGNINRAEDIALDYAVNAAEMDYRDLNAWKVKLVNGTSPELKERLTKAADDMEQILAPLQWNSSARPLAAKVRSDVGGVYVVDSFVSVLTKTMQAPEGLQSTATYSITIDSNNNWQIADVGGVDAVLAPK